MDVHQPPATVSRDEAILRVRSKEHLHQGMLSLNWFLPSVKANICTLNFLNDIRAERCFCPKFDQIKLKACLRPPNLTVLQEILCAQVTHITQNERDKGN